MQSMQSVYASTYKCLTFRFDDLDKVTGKEQNKKIQAYET